jgi:hypothetical protein
VKFARRRRWRNQPSMAVASGDHGPLLSRLSKHSVFRSRHWNFRRSGQMAAQGFDLIKFSEAGDTIDSSS